MSIFIKILFWTLIGILPATTLIGEAWKQATENAKERNDYEIRRNNGELPEGHNHLHGINFFKMIIQEPQYLVGLAWIIISNLMIFTHLLDSSDIDV